MIGVRDIAAEMRAAAQAIGVARQKLTEAQAAENLAHAACFEAEMAWEDARRAYSDLCAKFLAEHTASPSQSPLAPTEAPAPPSA